MLSFLCRALRAERHELPALAWSFAYFFTLLAGYYVLRPVRDEMGVQAGTAQLPWLFTATFVTMLLLVPLYGWLCARLPRARLLGVVQIRHEAPEHRHHEYVVDAHPHEERFRRRRERGMLLEQHEKDQQVDDEEQVDVRQETAARKARGDPPEHGDDRQHCDESRGEQPRQVLETGLDSHFVAHGAQHVVSAQQAEEIQE